jgi:hypothetical protein
MLTYQIKVDGYVTSSIAQSTPVKYKPLSLVEISLSGSLRFLPSTSHFLLVFSLSRLLSMENTNHGLNDLINQTAALGWSDTPPTLISPSSNPDSNPSFMLVGKILSSQPLSKNTIRNNILHAWSFVKSLVSEDRGKIC